MEADNTHCFLHKIISRLQTDDGEIRQHWLRVVMNETRIFIPAGMYARR